MIVGKQTTVFWNVEDLKMSHVDPKEVTKFMEWIEDIYRDLRITRGKVQKYLVMTLAFRILGNRRDIMADYINGVHNRYNR